MNDLDRYRVKPGSKVNLSTIDPAEERGDREEAEAEFARVRTRLGELQDVLYAQSRHALLVVIQAMDTGGKDSLIRAVFTGFNPAGCIVSSFKAPTEPERSHDFLWRIHACVPRLGYVGVFNRSHYEDVLIVRVKELVPAKIWKARYAHINDFERMLTEEGVTVVKFYLHISKGYQKQRLQRRLDDPSKHWKFDPNDLAERARWSQYRKAYEAALEKCSTHWAPWYVIPAEHRWYRNLVVARILMRSLQSMNLKYPKPAFDASKIAIK